MLSEEFVKEMEGKLMAEKERLEVELASLHAHTEIGDSLEDNAEEFPVDAVNMEVIATLKADLQKVEWALSKIAEGTYGVDEEGKEIGEDRLRAIPWADKAI